MAAIMDQHIRSVGSQRLAELLAVANTGFHDLHLPGQTPVRTVAHAETYHRDEHIITTLHHPPERRDASEAAATGDDYSIAHLDTSSAI